MSTIEEEIAREFGQFLKNHPAPLVKDAPQPVHSGNGLCVIGNNNIVLQTSRQRVVCVVQPGSLHISDANALELQQIVRMIVRQHGAPFQSVWTLLNRKMMVPSYRLTPAEGFEQARQFLEHWVRTGLPPA